MKLLKDNQQSIEGKLVESIKIEGLGEVAQEYTELGLDLVTKEGVLKDIPIVGTLVNAAKAVGSVRDRIYLRKLVLFLQKVGETTHKQRVRFIEDNCKDVKQFEEAVLLILEQADRIEKTKLIGKIFKACILDKINLKEALKLSDMVNRSFQSDLKYLLERRLWFEHLPRLYSAGLCKISGNKIRQGNTITFEYTLNDYAEALIMINDERYEDLKRCDLGVNKERE